jgi:hypothetical protein
MNVSSLSESYVDVMKIPYPVMVDKYRILTKSNNSSLSTNDYVPNGLLEILITPFDNVIELNIAQDINSKGEPVPYNLGEISTNSKLLFVFKSDSEKLEKEPFYEADNNFELGNISFKIEESDIKVIRRIYEKGYNNFYIVVNADSINSLLYSGKFVFYEDVVFVNNTNTNTSTSGTTGSTAANYTSYDTSITNTNNVDSAESKVDKNATTNNPFVQTNMTTYTVDPNVDKNYSSALVYVRFQLNMDKMDAFLSANGLTPYIKYGNVYYFDRLYVTMIETIKGQEFIEKLFVIPLGIGTTAKPA